MKTVVVAALLLLTAPALAASAQNAVSGTASEPGPQTQRRLDLNRATAADLVGIPGIGERLAQAIVELRNQKGSFAGIEDLLAVRGIGEKNLASLAGYLTVVPPGPASAGSLASPAR